MGERERERERDGERERVMGRDRNILGYKGYAIVMIR